MTKKEGGARVPVGGLVLREEDIEINAGREVVTIKVRNTGDRPIQVGSHFHFFEVNRYLEFDRERAFGMRMDIPATTAVRFEPGDEKTIHLVPFGGKRYAYGFNNLVDGWVGGAPSTYRPNVTKALKRAEERGFKSSKK
jgi:urease subunit beta